MAKSGARTLVDLLKCPRYSLEPAFQARRAAMVLRWKDWFVALRDSHGNIRQRTTVAGLGRKLGFLRVWTCLPRVTAIEA